jgi:hypothetical protein
MASMYRLCSKSLPTIVLDKVHPQRVGAASSQHTGCNHAFACLASPRGARVVRTVSRPTIAILGKPWTLASSVNTAAFYSELDGPLRSPPRPELIRGGDPLPRGR